MEKTHFVTVQSFWMFVAGLIAGILIILATMTAQQVTQDGEANLLRYRYYTPTVDVNTRGAVDTSATTSSNLAYPTGGANYPTGGANYPTGGANYPTGGAN